MLAIDLHTHVAPVDLRSQLRPRRQLARPRFNPPTPRSSPSRRLPSWPCTLRVWSERAHHPNRWTSIISMSLTHAMIREVYLADQVPEHVQWPDDVGEDRREDEEGHRPVHGEVGLSLAQHSAGGSAWVIGNTADVRVLCAVWMRRLW